MVVSKEDDRGESEVVVDPYRLGPVEVIARTLPEGASSK